MIPYTEKNGTLIFSIQVQPNAPSNQIIGEHGSALKIKIAAPPVEGKANRECIKFLADVFQISTKDITIISGATSRNKLLSVSKISSKQFEEYLSTL